LKVISRAQHRKLWLGARIPIIVVSGEVNSGKTLFGLTIDDDCRPDSDGNFIGDPPTLVWDQEGSAETYAESLNFDWRDVRNCIAEGKHMDTRQADANAPHWLKVLLQNADVQDSPQASLFRAWYMDLLDTPSDRYRVGMTDTFTPLQEGLIEWLKTHPAAFGRTREQYTKASSMFLWPDVKAVLAHILATECRLRFQTFVISVHLKNEWKGGAKTGDRIPEGLDIIDKLATLHLELDRSAKAKGKQAPRVPAAIVRKERLVMFGATADDDKPILPPRLPKATPTAIREYIKNPPDYNNLKPDERLPSKDLTEDQKLLLQASIASDQRLAEEARLAQAQQVSIVPQFVPQAQSSPQVAAEPDVNGPVQSGTTNEVIQLLQSGWVTEHELVTAINRQGGNRLSELTQGKAMLVLSDLHALAGERKARKAAENLEATNHLAPGSDTDETLAARKLNRIKALISEARILPEVLGDLVKQVNSSRTRASEMSDSEMDLLIEILEARRDGLAGPITDAQYQRITTLGERLDDEGVRATGEFLTGLGLDGLEQLNSDQADELIHLLLQVELGFTEAKN
jgi:hypothetical protein